VTILALLESTDPNKPTHTDPYLNPPNNPIPINPTANQPLNTSRNKTRMAFGQPFLHLLNQATEPSNTIQTASDHVEKAYRLSPICLPSKAGTHRPTTRTTQHNPNTHHNQKSQQTSSTSTCVCACVCACVCVCVCVCVKLLNWFPGLQFFRLAQG
jgi:hypothetical protein